MNVCAGAGGDGGAGGGGPGGSGEGLNGGIGAPGMLPASIALFVWRSVAAVLR